VTPSIKPVTRLTSAWVRDQGMRPVVATITGSVIELRAKGRRQTETLDIASLYFQAVKARIAAEKRAKREARRGK
jgi:hypothetical protein